MPWEKTIPRPDWLGVNSAADVFGDRGPSVRISGGRRVGVTLGERKARGAAIKHGVPRVASDDRETDSRSAALRLERPGS